MLANLNDILPRAQKGGYAVGLFNTIDTDMLQGAVSAAEELNSPIIIGTAEVLLPYGELSLIAPAVINAAKNASVPVVVHYDHGLTFDRCLEALKLGFSSVMFDASVLDYDENINQTREIVKIAHALGATVEGEIGHVGSNGADSGGDVYTSAKMAKNYTDEANVDACAVAFGTAHGKYLKKPKLDFERLKEIRKSVDTPLVMHGGSGLSDSDFKTAVQCGIAKINIFTDLCTACESAVKSAIEKNMNYLEMRNEKVNAIKEAVKKKILLFGSQNKA